MHLNRSSVLLPALLALILPAAANAQAPSYASGAETIRGTIASVESVNHIFVADDRGYTDDVTLRPGAQVTSSGVRLEPGQRVTITGSNGGSTFLATRIATNGSQSASSSVAYAVPVPVPAYYPAPVYYPAPYYYAAPYFGVSLYFGRAYGYGYGRYGYGYRGGYYGGGYHGGYHGGRR